MEMNEYFKNIKTDTIVYTCSYGVRFYKIVKRMPKSVKYQEIGSKMVTEGRSDVYVVDNDSKPFGAVRTAKFNKAGYFKINGQIAYVDDGNKISTLDPMFE